MNIQLKDRKIFIDGKDSGNYYRGGCGACGISASIIWNEEGQTKVYKIKDKSDHGIVRAVQTLVCKSESIRKSKQFASEILEECERCMNDNLELVEK